MSLVAGGKGNYKNKFLAGIMGSLMGLSVVPTQLSAGGVDELREKNSTSFVDKAKDFVKKNPIKSGIGFLVAASGLGYGGKKFMIGFQILNKVMV